MIAGFFCPSCACAVEGDTALLAVPGLSEEVDCACWEEELDACSLIVCSEGFIHHPASSPRAPLD